MDSQGTIICEKHKRRQKSLHQLPGNYFICMNRYCPQAYSVLCDTCKTQHRDHHVKVLSIEDIAFLIDRLLKMPFRQVGTFIVESVEILKKLKLVHEFSKKISRILQELQQETLDFITMTENIVSEYAQCKNSATQISEALADLQTKQAFDEFKKNSIMKLKKIDYNIQKDRLEYGNLQIKEKQDTRRKNLTFIKRKIEEVKEYSMKIIEVILNNDESDEQEEDIGQKKKNYESLKAQISQIVRKQMAQKLPIKNQKPVEVKKEQKIVQKKQMEIQSDNKWIQQQEKVVKNLQSQLQAANLYQKKIESDHKIKVYSMQKQKQSLTREKQALFKQKQNLKKQKQKIQKLFEQKVQFFNHYERRLRDNFQKRSARYKEREQIIKQLSQLIEHQRIDSRGRGSVQKQNRTNSKSKKS